jgi:hypothetical protein
MRIRVVRAPTVESIDGIQFDVFRVGREYEVGNSIGAVMLAEGWAVPLALNEPIPVPFTETDPFADRPYRDKDAPPNLTREHYPPFLDGPTAVVEERERRRRRRS